MAQALSRKLSRLSRKIRNRLPKIRTKIRTRTIRRKPSTTSRASSPIRTTYKTSTLGRLGITTPNHTPTRRRQSASPTRSRSPSPGYVSVSAQDHPQITHYPVAAATNANGAEVSEFELEKTPVSQIGNNRLGPNLNERYREQIKYCSKQMDEVSCNKQKVILKSGDKNLCRWNGTKCEINSITN